MTLIEWLDSYRIGIPSVDHEHRELIALINRLHARLSDDAPAEEIVGFLGEIDSAISAHFALEEREMRAMRYDQYAEHKAEHERLLDDIGAIAAAFEQGAYDDYADVLAEHLERWFSEHFRTHDARLHRFLQRRAT